MKLLALCVFAVLALSISRCHAACPTTSAQYALAFNATSWCSGTTTVTLTVSGTTVSNPANGLTGPVTFSACNGANPAVCTGNIAITGAAAVSSTTVTYRDSTCSTAPASILVDQSSISATTNLAAGACSTTKSLAASNGLSVLVALIASFAVFLAAM
jgi:hypothetical protein